VPLDEVRLAARAEGWRLTALAAQRFHEPGHPGVMLDPQGPPDVRAGGPLIPPLAARAVHDLCVGGVVAVRAAIARAAGAIERHQVRGQAYTRGRGGRHATVEVGDAIRIERIERPAERSIMELLGVKQPRRQASRERLILAKPRHQGAWLGHNAAAVEDHRVDGMARGDDPHLRVVLGRLVHDVAKAECVQHAGDAAQMSQDLAAVAVLSVHGALLCW